MTKIVDQVRDCDTVATISAALAKVKILSETFLSFPLLCIIFVNLPNNLSQSWRHIPLNIQESGVQADAQVLFSLSGSDLPLSKGVCHHNPISAIVHSFSFSTSKLQTNQWHLLWRQHPHILFFSGLTPATHQHEQQQGSMTMLPSTNLMSTI